MKLSIVKALVVALMLCGYTGVAVADKAPGFALKDVDGKEVKLADYAGKIVVLEWTNQNCPFVKRHYKAGTMKNLAQKYSPQGVVWLTIDSTHSADVADLKEWRDEQKITSQVLFDQDGSVGKAYGAKTTPHLYVIDKNGDIAYRGAIDDDDDGSLGDKAVNYVDRALTDLTSGKAIKIAATQPYGCSVKYG